MSVVLVMESTTKAHKLAPYFQEKWPGERVFILHTLLTGPHRFVIPHSLSPREVPVIRDLQFEMNPHFHWRVLEVGKSDNRARESSAEEVESLVRQAQEIYFGADPDHTGATAFWYWMRQYFPERTEYPAFCWYELSPSGVRDTLERPVSFTERFGSSLSFGEAKKFFDYNFLLNSLLVFGPVLRSVDIDTSRARMSKYMLQALYFIQEHPDLEESGLMQHFGAWKGTGKYSTSRGRTGLGGPASYHAIVRNLLQMGLLESRSAQVRRLPEWEASKRVREPGLSEEEYLYFQRIHHRLSPRGEAFLSSLHPDCRDPDLPFRLGEWCSAGLDSSRASMERYLRTFFGKQARFFMK